MFLQLWCSMGRYATLAASTELLQTPTRTQHICGAVFGELKDFSLTSGTVGVAFNRIQKDVKPLNFIEFQMWCLLAGKKIWRKQWNAWAPDECGDILRVTGTQLRLQLQIHPTLLAEACHPGAKHRQRLRTTVGLSGLPWLSVTYLLHLMCKDVQSCFGWDLSKNKMDAERAHKCFPSNPPECGSQEYDRPDRGRSQPVTACGDFWIILNLECKKEETVMPCSDYDKAIAWIIWTQ